MDKEMIKANKRLFDAIVALHPELCMGVKKEEELYLAMHLAKQATYNEILEAKQLLPKHLSNIAYTVAKGNSYDGFVNWWNEQKVGNEDTLAFEEAVKPAIEWLSKNGDPNTIIIVRDNKAELMQGEKSFNTKID